MAVEVNGEGSTFKVGAARSLFEMRQAGQGYSYDVSADGQRFLVNTAMEAAPATITVAVNWPALLQR